MKKEDGRRNRRPVIRHADRARAYSGEARSGRCLQGGLRRERAATACKEPGIARFDVLAAAGRPDPIPAGRDLPHARGARRPQADGPLQEVGRDGGRHDGRAAVQREVRRTCTPKTASYDIRIRHRRTHRVRMRHVAAGPRPGAGTSAARRCWSLGGTGRRGEALAAGLDALGSARWSSTSAGSPPPAWWTRRRSWHARSGCDLVIAVGGGSVIDAGKAVAGLLANPGDVLDYLEVVGGGKPLPARRAVHRRPTTAGTGTEVDAQRGAGRARAEGEGQPAEPPPAAPRGRRRSRADAVAPARGHGLSPAWTP